MLWFQTCHHQQRNELSFKIQNACMIEKKITNFSSHLFIQLSITPWQNSTFPSMANSKKTKDLVKGTSGWTNRIAHRHSKNILKTKWFG
jgi:hypothetical protein